MFERFPQTIYLLYCFKNRAYKPLHTTKTIHRYTTQSRFAGMWPTNQLAAAATP
jgi:hypothetical protein